MTSPTIDEREYWDRRSAELDEDMAADARMAVEPQTILHRLEVQLSATPDTDTQRRNALQCQIDALAAEIAQGNQSRFLGEWTRDVTIARRAEWNARAGNGEFSVKGKPSMQLVAKAEQGQGWTLQALKQAVAHHGM